MNDMNYYQLLGLECDPPENDLQKIERAIATFLQSNHSYDPDTLLLLVQDMRSLLMDPKRANEAKAEAAQAVRLRYEPLDTVINHLAENSEPPALSLAWAGRIARATGYPEAVVEARLMRNDEMLVPQSPRSADMNWRLLEEIDGLLEAVGAQSLNAYALNLVQPTDCTVENVWMLPAAQLYHAFGTGINRARKRSTEHLRLCNILHDFLDPSLRAAYETQLSMRGVYECEKQVLQLERNGMLLRTTKEAHRLLNKLIKALDGDKKKALELYKMLFFHPLAMPLPGGYAEARDCNVCCWNCGLLQRIKRRSKMECRSCKVQLTMKCEKCGRAYLPLPEKPICSYCGYDPSLSRQVDELLRQAEQALELGYTTQAQALRTQALTLDMDRAARLISDADKGYIQTVARLLKERKFYTLRNQLRHMGRLRDAEDLSQHVQKVISQAEEQAAKLPLLKELEQYQTLCRLRQQIADLPDFPAMTACYTPLVPQDVSYTVDRTMLNLLWQYPNRPEACFELLSAEPANQDGQVLMRTIARDLKGSSCTIEIPSAKRDYFLRASIFGRASALVFIGCIGSLPWIQMSACLQHDGLLLRWNHPGENMCLKLIKQTGSICSDIAEFPPGTVMFLDEAFERESVAQYILVDAASGTEVGRVKAGIPALQIQPVQEGSFTGRCMYAFEPLPDYSVCWMTGTREDIPLVPGVYAQNELPAAETLHFTSAGKGSMVCTPGVNGRGFVQPVFQGGGCLRVLEPLYPQMCIPSFERMTCGMTRKGHYTLEAPWPEGTVQAVVTACATHYALPDEHCGEVDMRVRRDGDSFLRLTIPWSLTSRVCIALYAEREIDGTLYHSEGCKVPVMQREIQWNVSRTAGRQVVHMQIDDDDFASLRPGMNIVNEQGEVLRHIAPSVLQARKRYSASWEVPQSATNPRIVWATNEHDLFRLEQKP